LCFPANISPLGQAEPDRHEKTCNKVFQSFSRKKAERGGGYVTLLLSKPKIVKPFLLSIKPASNKLKPGDQTYKRFLSPFL
jgi:hypothetical protein